MTPATQNGESACRLGRYQLAVLTYTTLSLFILKGGDDFIVMQKYTSCFGKIYVITVCHEDIYGRYCIQKSNNDHFHLYFDIIVKMKGSSFPVVYNILDRDFFH